MIIKSSAELRNNYRLTIEQAVLSHEADTKAGVADHVPAKDVIAGLRKITQKKERCKS